jgi:soluble lytic murein transglycosylase-like protein
MIDRNQDMRGAEERGPFPALRGREHPWKATEVEHGPFERRRAGDRRTVGLTESAAADLAAEEAGEARGRRKQWGRRKADVLTSSAQSTLTARSRVLVRRFREPLIGLTLAGVAVPLINAGLALPEEADPADVLDADRAVAGERDLEGEVGDYWAESAESVVRAQTIEGAAVRYGITPDLAEKIYDAATRHDIEPDVGFGLVYVESTFRERAVSHVGARGLAQVMPRTAQWLDPTITVRDLYDPETNLELGFRYLRQMIDKYNGDVFKALTAYNRGPGTVDRILRRGGNIDNGYAGKVMAG